MRGARRGVSAASTVNAPAYRSMSRLTYRTRSADGRRARKGGSVLAKSPLWSAAVGRTGGGTPPSEKAPWGMVVVVVAVLVLLVLLWVAAAADTPLKPRAA